MNPTQQAQLIDLIQSQKWWLVGALLVSVIIGAVIRMLKNDVSATPTIPARWRPVVATGLGLLAGILSAIAGGVPLVAAILGGLATGGLPVLGHEVVVNGLRGGRDIAIPKIAGLAVMALASLWTPLAMLLLLCGFLVASQPSCTPGQVKDITTKVVNDAPIVCAALVPLIQEATLDTICEIVEQTDPAIRDIAHDVFAARKTDALKRKRAGEKLPPRDALPE